MEEAEQEVDGSIRHVHNGLDMAAKLIVAGEESGFARQVFFNGLTHTGVEKFGMRRGVEEAVKVCRVIQDFNVGVRCRTPIDGGKESARVAIEDGAM
jgi:hypothetical protein